MKTIAAPLAEADFTDPGERRWALPLAMLFVMGLAFWPVWRWYVLRMDDGSDEPMGLAALGLGAWFLWQERDRLSVSGRSLLAASIGLVVYTLAFPIMLPLVRAVVALGIVGIAIRLDRVSPGIWGLLFLSLPVVATLQFYAGWPLRQFTAVGAEWLLTTLSSMEVTRTGTVLWWQGQPVGIDAPCSGIRMLWTGLVLHFLLASNYRVRLLPLLGLTVGAMVVIVLANLLRATGLFLKESGAVNLPSWTHEGIGLVIFAGVVFIFARVGDRFRRDDRERSERNRNSKSEGLLVPPRVTGIFLVAAGLAALAPVASSTARGLKTGEIQSEAAFPGWPSEWEGKDLVPVSLSPGEQAFAADFPGRVAVFRTAEGPWSKRLIFRWVTRPTRKLHSSADCLKATGLVVESKPGVRDSVGGGDRWATWVAYDASRENLFRVRERLWEDADPDRAWAEVSAWFWEATLGKTSGPWWALTVMEPETQEAIQ